MSDYPAFELCNYPTGPNEPSSVVATPLPVAIFECPICGGWANYNGCPDCEVLRTRQREALDLLWHTLTTQITDASNWPELVESYQVVKAALGGSK